MKIIIFGNPINQAQIKFNDLMSKINNPHCKISKSFNEYRAEFYNGVVYITAYAGDSARGHRCDKVYVPIDIDSEILNCVIRPILFNSTIPKDEQIVYY